MQQIHPDSQTLIDFVAGKLAPNDAAAIEDHLKDCDTCLNLLESSSIHGDPLLKELRGVHEAATVPPAHFPDSGAGSSELGESAVARVMRAVRSDEPASPEPLDPMRSFGDYELLEEIARGGMGVVYKARQVSLNRIVAVKMILAGELASEADIKRFRGEAEAAANLQHPNIVAIHEVGEHDGQHYFSMDYVEGKDLAALVRENPLPPARAAGYVKRIAEAVEYAHQHGILHRDLKPSNVLIDQFDQPRITDFGLAKRVAGGSDLTGSGTLVGTPSYMPPEQADGKRGSVSPASDVYALGAILYELVTGRPPFRAETPLDTLLQVLNSDPVSPRLLNSKLNRDMETICLKCLQKEPSRRYASGQDLADDLGRLLNGEPIHARPVAATERLWRWCRRNPFAAAFAGAVAGFLVLATVAALITAEWERKVAVKESNLRAKAELAYDQAQESRKQKDEALTQKDEALSQATQQVAIRNAATGVRFMEDGDLMRSLLWFAEALRLDKGDPSREEVHRIRLASLLSQCPKLIRLWFHEDSANHAEFSPDGNLVVTASDDLTARILNVQTGELAGRQLQHDGAVRTASFSFDNRHVVTASQDGQARIWDTSTGEIRFFLKHSQPVNHASFSKDGRRVVSASDDGTGRIWDAETGKQIGESLQHAGPVRYAEFSHDGRRVVTASDDKSARVWDAATGIPVSPSLKHDGDYAKVHHASFSPDDNSVVTASENQVAQVWHATSGAKLSTPLGHWHHVNGAWFSPDGRRVLIAGEAHSSRLFDALTGSLIGEALHDQSLKYASFSPDGRRVITASVDRTARVWDANNLSPNTPPLLHSAVVLHCSFSPDGRRVVTSCSDGTVRVWDLATQVELKWTVHHSPVHHPPEPYVVRQHHAIPPLEHKGVVTCVSVSRDGSRIASGAMDNTAKLWNTDTVQCLFTFQHNAPVHSVSFSPDGHRLLSASADGTGRIWDTETGKQIGESLPHQGPIRYAEFSNDGCRVVTASDDNSARVWDSQTGKAITGPLKHPRSVLDASFSPDGRHVVTASDDLTAQIWSAETGKKVGEGFQHNGPVRHARFSPDGSRLVTASDDWKARVWDASTGRVVVAIKHEHPVRNAEFSNDGLRIVTASFDHTARVWDAETGDPVTLPLQHRNWVLRASFSPDGQFVVTWSTDGYARVWDATTGHPVYLRMTHHRGDDQASFNSDGRRIFTSDGNTVLVWDLPGFDGPVQDLLQLVQVLTGQKLDNAGGFEAVDREKLQVLWKTLQPKYADSFECSRQAALAWHEAEARQCEEARNWLEAAAHYDPLIEASPLDPKLRTRRAVALLRIRQWDKAIADYSKVIEIKSDDWDAWHQRGHVHEALRRWEESVADFTKAVELKENAWHVFIDRGKAYAELRDWPKAVADYGRVFKLTPPDDSFLDDAFLWFQHAHLRLETNDSVGYQELCQKMLARFNSAPDYAAHLLDHTLALGPNTAIDPLRLVQRAREHTPSNPQQKPWYQHALGLALYRAGMYEQAVECLKQALDENGAWGGQVLEWLVLAMAHHQLGHSEEAKNWLGTATQWLDQATLRDPVLANITPNSLKWWDWLEVRHLRREAEALFTRGAP